MYSSVFNHSDSSKPGSSKSKKLSFLGSLFSRKKRDGDRKPRYTTAVGSLWDPDKTGYRTLPSMNYYN